MDKIRVTVGDAKAVNVKIRGGGGELPYYDGSYTVKPKIGEAQTLETARRSMRSNVTVEEIPVGQVENRCGGYTVIIG